MKRTGLLICALCALLMVACGPNRKESIAEIKAYETQLQTLTVEEAKADSIIVLYVNFANNFEEDSLAPMFLMKAADVAINLGRSNEGIEYLDRVIDEYPDFKDLAGCYFLKGYAYEKAGELESARAAYSYFIETYPDHVLANDTRAILPYLGLSPEDLLELLWSKDSVVAENLRKDEVKK